jgi:hypothetical protein
MAGRALTSCFIFSYFYLFLSLSFLHSGMAINISMMFGRIGSVMGTNVVGFTLDHYCSATFAVSASIMSACGVLAFFIPNIRQVDGGKDKKRIDKTNL